MDGQLYVTCPDFRVRLRNIDEVVYRFERLGVCVSITLCRACCVACEYVSPLPSFMSITPREHAVYSCYVCLQVVIWDVRRQRKCVPSEVEVNVDTFWQSGRGVNVPWMVVQLLLDHLFACEEQAKNIVRLLPLFRNTQCWSLRSTRLRRMLGRTEDLTRQGLPGRQL